MWFSDRQRLPDDQSPALSGFLVLWLFIAFVSVHDGFLVVLYRDALIVSERNPICTFLLELNGGGIGLLLAAKALGTALVCTLLLVLFRKNRRLGRIVAAGIAGFQFCLLLYLSLA